METTEDAESVASLSSAKPSDASGFRLLRDVEVEITVEIGRKRMRIVDILRLGSGDTLEFTKAAGDPLDIYVNGTLLGRGEPVVVGDRYGVRITRIESPKGGEP